MEDLLLSMIFLAFFKMLFEEARISSWVTRLIHAVVYGAVILFAHFVTQHLSLPRFLSLLNTPESLRNLSLFVMLDLFVVLYVAMYYVRRDNTVQAVRGDIPLGTSRAIELPQQGTRFIDKLGRFFKRLPLYAPSLLLLPALFYVRLQLFYVFPGVSFLQVTLALVIFVALVTLLSPQLMKLFVNVKRPELLSQGSLTLSLITFLLVVAAGVLHPDSHISGDYSASANWLELLSLCIVVLVGGLGGYFLSRRTGKRTFHE